MKSKGLVRRRGPGVEEAWMVQGFQFLAAQENHALRQPAPRGDVQGNVPRPQLPDRVLELGEQIGGVGREHP